MDNLAIKIIPHLENTLIVLSAVACFIWAWLVMLKTIDLLKNEENGPIKFMLRDNLRHGVTSLLMSLLMLLISIIALREEPNGYQYIEMKQSYQSILVCCFINAGLIFEALARFRRRIKMDKLIRNYKGKPGGRRVTDPPGNGSKA